MRRILVSGLLLAAAAGCTVAASSGRRHPPGHAYGHAHRAGPPAGGRLVLIQGTGLQYVDQPGVDRFLHDGIWFKFDGGVWLRSVEYGGTYVRIAGPPAAFGKIPPGHAKWHAVHGPKVKGPKPGRGRGRKSY